MSMIKAQIIKKNGKKEFAILPYEDFLKVQEDLEDYEDLRCLREAKVSEKDAPTISLSDLKKHLDGQKKSPSRRAKTSR